MAWAPLLWQAFLGPQSGKWSAASLFYSPYKDGYLIPISAQTDYLLKTHNLAKLINYNQSLRPWLSRLLPHISEERRLFNLLQKAYSAARYATDYVVTAYDVQVLTAWVQQLCGE